MSRPRRGNERTPSDATPPVRTGRVRSTAEKVVAVAKSMPPAQPGARGAGDSAPSDYSVTSRIDRLPSEHTPAPLPPSPAAEAADVWFDQVPTNPAAIPDLGNMAGSRPDLAAAVRAGTAGGRADGRDPWASPSALYAAADRLPVSRRPWVLPVLIAATALTVGMVLGALIFGGGSSSDHAKAAPCQKAPTGPEPPAKPPQADR